MKNWRKDLREVVPNDSIEVTTNPPRPDVFYITLVSSFKATASTNTSQADSVAAVLAYWDMLRDLKRKLTRCLSSLPDQSDRDPGLDLLLIAFDSVATPAPETNHMLDELAPCLAR